MMKNAEKYFKSLNELNKSLALENISMGMSADYIEAIKHGSTFCKNRKFYFWFTILTLVFFFNFLKFLKDEFF